MKYSTKEAYEQIKKFPIVFAALIVELFLMINGSYLFQAPSIYSTTQIEIFVLTIAVFSLLSGYTIENGLNFETFKTFKYFVPSFLIAFVMSILFIHHSSYSGTTGKILLGLLVYSVFIVAFSQEIAFRVIASEVLRRVGVGNAATVIIQAIAFGILYFSFYSNSPAGSLYGFLVGLILALVLGTIYSYISKKERDYALGVVWGANSGFYFGFVIGVPGIMSLMHYFGF